MRVLNFVIFLILVGVIVVFAFQNMQGVTVTFLEFSLAAPMAAVVITVYVLGMLTGSTLIGAIRKSWEKSRRN
jgi:uncharacterized integral membrane protein